MEPLLLRALKNEQLPRPPVWLMRQAGRYLPEYRLLRERHSFLELCKSVELAKEISLLPLKFLDVDAVILFSDILIPVEAMGVEISFHPAPRITNPVKTTADISKLKSVLTDQSLAFVFHALEELRTELEQTQDNASKANQGKKALIGFAGAPWTLACYILDQGPFKHFQGTQVFAYQHRSAMHDLLAKLETVITSYLLRQIESGAQAVQLFDTWAGNLTAEDYQEFALPYTQRILAAVQSAGSPSILYVGNSSHLLPTLKTSGATCISVDARVPLQHAAQVLGEGIVLQGNFDPTHLFGPVEQVKTRTTQMISQIGRTAGYIANLGHGILPTTPPENALCFVNTVKVGWAK